MTSIPLDDFSVRELPMTMHAPIIKKLGPAESLKIATNNKDFRKILSMNKLSAISLYYKFEVNFWDDRVFIEVDFGDNTSKFWICVPSGTPVKLGKRTKKRQTPLEIDDIVFQWKEFKGFTRINKRALSEVMCLESDRTVPGVNQWEVLEMYAKFLMDLIKVEKVNIHGSFSEDNDLFESFLWKHQREISDIIADLENEKTPMENFQFFNEQLAIEKCKLTFHEETSKEHLFAYKNPITMRDFTLYEADFLHQDAILNSSCSIINLYIYAAPYSLMNSVVRSWMNGGLANLQKMKVTCNHHQRSVEDEHSLDCFVTINEDPERSPNLRVIRRPNDDAQATIWYDYKRNVEFEVQKPLTEAEDD